MFGCEMDDPRIENMDPMKKMWYFHQWVGDQYDQVELAKNHAYLLGSFYNPEAVQKLLGQGGRSYKSTDDEFDKTTELMEQEIKRAGQDKTTTESKGKKKKKRKLKDS